MWNIITALIYFFVIVPRWRLTSRDVAGVRRAIQAQKAAQV
jgi:hypothetical protein